MFILGLKCGCVWVEYQAPPFKRLDINLARCADGVVPKDGRPIIGVELGLRVVALGVARSVRDVHRVAQVLDELVGGLGGALLELDNGVLPDVGRGRYDAQLRVVGTEDAPSAWQIATPTRLPLAHNLIDRLPSDVNAPLRNVDTDGPAIGPTGVPGLVLDVQHLEHVVRPDGKVGACAGTLKGVVTVVYAPTAPVQDYPVNGSALRPRAELRALEPIWVIVENRHP